MLGEEDPEDPRSFARQPIPIRIIVLAAGSIMNMLVAILVFTSISALPHDVVIGDISIAGVAPYSPAEQANLKVGDIIESVNGVRVNTTSTLIRTGRFIRESSITIGADGLGVLSYYDFTKDDLMVGHCMDISCISITS